MADRERSDFNVVFTMIPCGLNFCVCIELLITNRFEGKSWPNGALCANLHWLETVLLPKIKHWAESISLPVDNGQLEKSSKVESLSLVSVEKYNKVYNELKQKYGPPLIQAWKENTDPQKFVYEDIGIAAYLLVLWKETSNLEKPSFIDLGCGNGLLVYILTKEGYPGKGIDVRRRGIWDFYGEEVCLEEVALHPNESTFEYDWIIGNHSDELTPWIPVIAARSSYTTSYFVLPCCLYDFCGKFNRNNPHLPQYRTYLDYVKEIGVSCGFNVEEDSLRIPSTKRICHVGRSKAYAKEDHDEIEEKLQDYLISQNCSLKLLAESSKNDADRSDKREPLSETQSRLGAYDTYKPRESKEKVRNCTQLERTLTDEIVNKVAFTLLDLKKNLEPEKTTDNSEQRTSNGSLLLNWKSGGSLSLSEVVELFEKETLLQLKSQCGGLQTLLRNHGHIFKVVKGQVTIRNFREPAQARNQANRRKPTQKTKENNFKTKLCWFHCNHPQGCPVSTEECKFAHGQRELRTLEGR